MSSIPITRTPVRPDAEAAIRKRVSEITQIRSPTGISRLITLEDADALYRYFAMPEVSRPIYTIAKPVTPETIRAQIVEKLAERSRGEGLLTASFNDAGEIISHLDHMIWPHWSAAEFGGSRHPSMQSQGSGKAGIFFNIDWVFEQLGIGLLCFTAALDNVRSIRLIDAMGMRRMGEIDSVSPTGSVRRSLVWEMTADEWTEFKLAAGR